jgi:hypothetical protein
VTAVGRSTRVFAAPGDAFRFRQGRLVVR